MKKRVGDRDVACTLFAYWLLLLPLHPFGIKRNLIGLWQLPPNRIFFPCSCEANHENRNVWV